MTMYLRDTLLEHCVHIMLAIKIYSINCLVYIAGLPKSI